MINLEEQVFEHQPYANDLSQEITPCTMCGGDMVCHNTAMISGENLQNHSHYLMACENCGYGPSQAFATCQLASAHWNDVASKDAPNLTLVEDE